MRIVNPHTRKIITAAFILSCLFSAAAYFAYGRIACVAAAVFCAVVNILYIADSAVRYKTISRYNDMLGRVLYSDEKIKFEDYSEGELSILNNEIQKLIRQLRDDARLLKNQKEFLADSIADISHQIKTPLTSVGIIVDMLGAENISDKRRFELTAQLQSLLNRIVWQIESLLKASKLDADMIQMQSENFGARGLIDKSLEPIRVLLELRGITVKVRVDPDSCIKGDIDWCSEAVENIVKNCIEHCENGGKIDIFCSENPLYTRVHIQDDGKGIDAEDLPHIFERFYQGKNPSANSYGIGLALAKMIIVRQNGTVRAYNRHDKSGAAFDVRFYKGAV